MSPAFHLAGCLLAGKAAAAALDDFVGWAQRCGARIFAHDETRAQFVQLDAADAKLVLFGWRAAVACKPPLLRFGFAATVKESGADGAPRAGERGLAQAVDLAGAAQPGQVLLSSQLASLLEMAAVEPYRRLRPLRVRFADGRLASAYEVEPLRAASA
jgi:hypothetical protein